MLRQSYDNYIQKEHNKLYQAVTQWSSILISFTAKIIEVKTVLKIVQ